MTYSRVHTRPHPPPCSELVTLIFPVGDYSGGPPFATKPDAVRALLEGAGFECAELSRVPPELSHPARAVRCERNSMRCSCGRRHGSITSPSSRARRAAAPHF